ncbi:hypothetical protein LXA43DRAFT_1102851 [Ganoderma leucocontextum]|nr:hypothetical protein LXA43DRAFT_1102851 [Ganoderma leucocontextum]
MLFDSAPVTVTFIGHLVHARYNTDASSPPTYSVAVECMTLTDHYALTNILQHKNACAHIPEHFLATIPSNSPHKVITISPPPISALTSTRPSLASSTALTRSDRAS